MICFVLRELHRGVALVSSFKFQVSGFKFQVSSFSFQVSVFKFQVSGFKFQVSSFRFQVWSWFLKLYLNLYLNLYLLSLRAKSRTIEKILHRAARSFFFDMLCVERATQRRCTCFKFQVSSLKLIYEVVLELVVNVKSSEVEIL